MARSFTLELLRKKLEEKQKLREQIPEDTPKPKPVTIRWKGEVYKSQVIPLDSFIKNTGFKLPDGTILKCKQYVKAAKQELRLLLFEEVLASSVKEVNVVKHIVNNAPKIVVKGLALKLTQLAKIHKDGMIKVEVEIELNDVIVMSAFGFDQYIDGLIVDHRIIGAMLRNISVKPLKVTEKGTILCEVSADASSYLGLE